MTSKRNETGSVRVLCSAVKLNCEVKPPGNKKYNPLCFTPFL